MSPLRTIPVDILTFRDRIVGVDVRKVIVIGAIVSCRAPHRLIADVHANTATPLLIVPLSVPVVPFAVIDVPVASSAVISIIMPVSPYPFVMLGVIPVHIVSLIPAVAD